ncbi:hypothetical protein [Synechococcus sp. MU1642]|uniref:hypothetical protein n=1 Tax=Synechococcus sp. MU1642 TaxID=2508348 RepID=UPI001CF8711E|nr:hypothetical protein [Synechococcus sp. MU1642]MCB4407190.1 hypothetical protein [Synechococcus sp. MU1642]
MNNNVCGCGSLIGVFLAIGLAGFLISEHGPIVGLIGGSLVGGWGGVKLGGCSIDELNTIDESQMSNKQKRALTMGAIGLLIGGIGGYGFGSEMQKELQDNAQIMLNSIGAKIG